MQNHYSEKRYFFLFCLILLFISSAFGQTIVIGTPTLGFSQACASQGFNTYNVSFTITPVANIQAGNEFRVELSNGSGNFSNPVVVKTFTATSSPASTTFALPTNTSGEAYKIRVRSTAPAVTSPSSVSFAAHYAAHNQAYSINNNVGTVSICENGNYTLQVDNTGTAASPLFYPNLVYKWYRNFNVIPGATSSSLVVTQTGNYYSIVDYGSCIMDSYSNIVTVNVTPGINLNITTTDNSDFICAGTSKTLVSSHQNAAYTYQWYKNNIAIAGATAATYAASTQGNYQLKITAGTCIFESNELFLELIQLNVDLNVASTEVLIPGQQLEVTSINNAISPTYVWKKDNVVIPTATTSSLIITQPGVYSLTVRENSGCTTLIQTETVTVQYPSNFVITAQNMNTYQACVSTTTTLSIASFIAQTPNGNISVSSNSSITWQWYKDNVVVSGATNSSLVVPTATLNGIYKVRANITGFSPVDSNEITVALKVPTPAVTATGNLCNGGTVTLTSSITAATYNYKWYRNNVVIPSATTPTYATTTDGNYYVTVNSMTCTETSNTVNLELNSITASITAPTSTVLIPGETKTLNATTSATQATYQWYLNNTIIAGATSSSLQITTSGTYKVAVSQNIGCIATQEASITIVNPTSYALTIGKESSYQDCQSTTTSLKIESFTAVSASGTVSILNNSFGYTYEWYKNGTLVTSGLSSTYTVSSNLGNGSYQLKVLIPNSTPISSNTTQVNLGVTEAYSVIPTGVLCENGGSVTLAPNILNDQYNYTWFKTGSTTTIGTTQTLVVNTEGNYFYTVTFSGCNYTSETVTLAINDGSTFDLNVSETVAVFQGSAYEVIASGADNYAWYYNGEEVATTSSFMVSEAGNYTVKGFIGTCEFSKTFEVTVIENSSEVIPNLITMNGDGKNEFWSLPAEYVNKEDVEVTLYATNGSLVFKTNNYQNNWPNESFVYTSKQNVLYYTISKEGTIIKKGSITIIK